MLHTRFIMKTIDQIRRDNLALAIAKVGSAAQLADKAGISSVYLSQIKMQALEQKTGKAKAMGDDVARKIENGLGLAHGWMDADHDPAGPLLEPVNGTQAAHQALQHIARLVTLYVDATEQGKAHILQTAELVPKKSDKARR